MPGRQWGMMPRQLPGHLSRFLVARWYVRNDEDAKDLVQEALLRAFRAFDRFEGSDGRSWLFTIIRNLYFSSVTRKVPDSAVFDEQIHGSGESSSDQANLYYAVVFCLMD